MAKDKTQAAPVAETPSKPKASRGKAKEEIGKDGNSLTGRIDQAKEFFDQAKGELKKVTWPTWSEWRVTTLMVFIMVVIATIFFFAVDSLIAFIVKQLIAS